MDAPLRVPTKIVIRRDAQRGVRRPILLKPTKTVSALFDPQTVAHARLGDEQRR